MFLYFPVCWDQSHLLKGVLTCSSGIDSYPISEILNLTWESHKLSVTIGIDDDVPGPHEVDHYNGPHGIKPGGADSFQTVLRCIFCTYCYGKVFISKTDTTVR